MAGEFPTDPVGEEAVRMLGALAQIAAQSSEKAKADLEAQTLAWQSFIGRALPLVARVIDVQGTGMPMPEPYKRVMDNGELTDTLPQERYVVLDVISDGRKLTVLVRAETDTEGNVIYNIDPAVTVAEDVDKVILAAQQPQDTPQAE